MPFIKAFKTEDYIASTDYDVFDLSSPIPMDTLTPIKLDYEKLSKYFTIKLVPQIDGKFYHQDFRQCTLNDF